MTWFSGFRRKEAVGNIASAGFMPPTQWWHQRLVVSFQPYDTKSQSRKENADTAEKLAVWPAAKIIEKLAKTPTLERIPTRDGVISQFVPFEHMVFLNNAPETTPHMPTLAEPYRTNFDDIVDRRLKPRFVSYPGQKETDAVGGRLYFGSAVFAPPSQQEVPRGRVFLRVEMPDLLDGPQKIDVPLVFGGGSETAAAGWFERQDRIGFDLGAHTPVGPWCPADMDETLAEALAQALPQGRFFVLAPTTQDRRPGVLTCDVQPSDGKKTPEIRRGAAIAHLAPSQDTGSNDLLYSAEIATNPDAHVHSGMAKSVSLCVEPNTAFTRLRNAPTEKWRSRFDVVGVLLPRVVKGNGLNEICVHFDDRSHLMAHSLRSHTGSVLIRQQRNGLDNPLSWLGMSDIDEILYVDQDIVLRDTLYGADTPKAHAIEIDDTGLLPHISNEIKNPLPPEIAGRHGASLPQRGMQLLYRTNWEALGHICLPFTDDAAWRTHGWHAPLPLVYRRGKDAGARSLLLDWLDEAIDIEFQDRTHIHETTRYGYARWLNQPHTRSFSFLRPDLSLCLDDKGKMQIREKIGVWQEDTALTPGCLYRVGPLIVRFEVGV